MLRFKTIRTKITVTVFSIFAFFLIVHMAYEYDGLKSREYETFESVNKTVNKLLVEYITAYVYTDDVANIQLSIDAIDSKYIKSIYILDKNGIIMVKNGEKNIPQIKHPKFESLLQTANFSIKNSNEHINLNTFKILDIPVGYMIVEANLQNFIRDMEMAKNKFLAEVLVFSFFLLMISMFISKSLSSPIENIVKILQDTKEDEILEIPEQIQEEFQYLGSSISNSHNRLLASNIKLKTIFDLTTDGIAIVDLHGRFLFVNNAYTKITGYSKKRLLDTSLFEILAPEFRDEMTTVIQYVLYKDSYPNFKASCIVESERRVDIVLSMNIMPSRKSIMLVTKDVTKENLYIKKRKEQEEYLIQQSRMAQMGEMISMIAHQWRQPLSSIAAISINLRLKIQLESFDLESKEGIKEYNDYFFKRLENIEECTQNLTTTIDDFRNFYKPNKESVTTTLEEVIAKALNVINESLQSNNIELECDYNSGKKMQMYDSELMQVILNILKNSQDNFREKAMRNEVYNSAEMPKITITTKNRTILICDNGGGIEKHILPKIFDPYFSTKDEKNGTGLGLYMSKTIIEGHHNGHLYVYNQEDDYGNIIGVCFEIELGELN